jgi:hypothetical protein
VQRRFWAFKAWSGGLGRTATEVRDLLPLQCPWIVALLIPTKRELAFSHQTDDSQLAVTSFDRAWGCPQRWGPIEGLLERYSAWGVHVVRFSRSPGPSLSRPMGCRMSVFAAADPAAPPPNFSLRCPAPFFR